MRVVGHTQIGQAVRHEVVEDVGVVDVTALAILVPRNLPQQEASNGRKVARDGRVLAEHVLAPGDQAVELGEERWGWGCGKRRRV